MAMEETPEQETSRLLAPYIAERNAAAQECLSALLDGRHAESTRLLSIYQVACMAVDAAETVCEWFDAGVEDEHVTVEHTDSQDDPPAAY